MSDKIQLIKELRAKGATIRMIDDVAAHLEENGGYSSPVFVATVEFIIKIRQMLQSVLQQHEQSVSIAEKFDEKDTENVDFGAAKSGVENDGEIEDYERAQILNHIQEIEARANVYIENSDYKERKNEQAQPQKKQKRESKRVNNLLEKIFKISALNSQKDKQQKEAQAQQQQQQTGQQAQRENARQNANVQQQAQVVQATQRSSITRMNIVRMNLMKILKVVKDMTVVGDAARQARKETQAHAQPQPQPQTQPPQQRHQQENVSIKAAERKTNPNIINRDKKNVNEVSISKVIDEAVKTSKAAKKPTDEKSPAEKGKFEKQHGEKSGPKADEKKVSEMAVKEAIDQLQKSGVRTAAPDAKTKKEVEAQITQIQGASGGATPKLQR